MLGCKTTQEAIKDDTAPEAPNAVYSLLELRRSGIEATTTESRYIKTISSAGEW